MVFLAKIPRAAEAVLAAMALLKASQLIAAPHTHDYQQTEVGIARRPLNRAVYVASPEAALGHRGDGHTTHDGHEREVDGQGEELLQEHGREERREGGLRSLDSTHTRRRRRGSGRCPGPAIRTWWQRAAEVVHSLFLPGFPTLTMCVKLTAPAPSEMTAVMCASACMRATGDRFFTFCMFTLGA